MKKVTLLGGTGSIGLQTIEVLKQHPEQFELYAFAFGAQVDKALPIIQEMKPKYIVTKDENIKEQVEKDITYDAKVSSGLEALRTISSLDEIDIVVNAILGSIGLQPTLDAIRAKKQIAFANKETLVTAGHLVMEEARKHNVELLPVDSEHAAIHQCLKGESKESIKRIILTGSGGSFRDRSRAELKGVTKSDALKHPNWSMGAKITIDSATMMNKGLEVIEAHWLFDVPYDQIDVILHKESVIHSMVEFNDQSVMAQLGTPDMRIPIQYALTYPGRSDYRMSQGLDLLSFGQLHFQEMSFERFPCLEMAYNVGKTGGSLPTVFNAANEEAVQLFLEDKITFLDIEEVIEKAVSNHETISKPDLDTIISLDQETRERVKAANG
ncbi:1-deoxy-D-xylulose-5-phosphate reductoisomerase [Halalkalibacillus sediminis]|uniref:1-deoxy-D-xylulose 5-phosphate reductoisomerase n=1 Tax=Halalkalibacillus sediminis TaxID=2018042 RepID=A0A2I0QWF6_9BACI|nr:1-deoxy-D-xylulose-5-phosphate reductoisomerase [Halalkalibacillus sediminis]PKR78655.1 1-deoxy-D-xylulose-5-phosphate reductoisomerase [Halalkalibacillus sediminis]